jgi:hypothetical protein
VVICKNTIKKYHPPHHTSVIFYSLHIQTHSLRSMLIITISICSNPKCAVSCLTRIVLFIDKTSWQTVLVSLSVLRTLQMLCLILVENKAKILVTNAENFMEMQQCYSKDQEK